MNVIQQRGGSYGPVQRGGNITRISKLWSAYLGVDLSEHDVAWMMTLLKASRSRQDPTNLDNYVDGRAYIEIAERLR